MADPARHLPAANARPALAEVLGALTHTHDVAWWRGQIARPRPYRIRLHRSYDASSPTEALEVLHIRDLWPWEMGDPRAPRWWCAALRCSDCKHVEALTSTVPVGMWRCPRCRCIESTALTVDRDTPPTIPALVAVASLGVDRLRTIAALCVELVRDTAEVVWRVMSKEALAAQLYDNCRWMSDGDDGPVSLYAVGAAWTRERLAEIVREECPLTTERAEKSWPLLRDLALLGVHLLAFNARRVVIGVEALS